MPLYFDYNLNELAQEALNIAVQKRSWGAEQSTDKLHMLIIAELSKASEAYSKDEKCEIPDLHLNRRLNRPPKEFMRLFNISVYNTYQDRIAKAAIGILNYAASEQIDIVPQLCATNYQGSEDIDEMLLHVIHHVIISYKGYEMLMKKFWLSNALLALYEIGKKYDFDLVCYIRQRRKYNKCRKWLRGRKNQNKL